MELFDASFFQVFKNISQTFQNISDITQYFQKYASISHSSV